MSLQQQPTLLIIDKSLGRRQWLKKNFIKDYRLLFAPSCQVGYAIFKKEAIDLVLIDDGLKEMKQFAFCKKLHRRQGNGHTALLVMTKNENIPFFHDALRAGVADLIHKPLNSFSIRKSVYLALQLQYKLITMGHKLSDFKKMATRDSLTRLYNRRYLMQQGQREIAKAHREKSSLSALMLDIDHFKEVNSNYGHLAGDDILLQFARLLTLNLRNYDVIVRYGGEEFVVLLPYTTCRQAHTVAEKLRGYIANYPFFNGTSYFHLFCSIGVSCLKKGQTLQDLINHADHALLRAKNLGRNRVLLYRPLK